MIWDLSSNDTEWDVEEIILSTNELREWNVLEYYRGLNSPSLQFRSGNATP